MKTQTSSHVIDVTESDYRRWLKSQPWNQPGYIAEKMKKHAEAGELMGAAPVGYLNTFVDGKKAVVTDRRLAPLVQEAFALAKTGRYSVRQLLPLVTDCGLVSRNGAPLQATGLWRILTNPFYCGLIQYKKELIAGKHEPLIDTETFDHVQQTIKSRRRN